MIASYPSLNFGFDEETTMLQDMARQFAQQEIAPLAEQIDKENSHPRELWQKMGELGLLGITVDEKYGGSRLGYLAHCVVMEEISRASASIGLSYGAHSNLCVNQIHENGTAEQKSEFLPKLCSGEHIGALAMSESGAGSDVVNMSLKATPTDGGFLLNGHKLWITNGPEADIVVVYAKTDSQLGAKGITAFIFATDTPGFSRSEKFDKLGMRGSGTCELRFDDAFVPESNILGTINEGVKVLMSGLDFERTVLAAGPVGIMAACLDLVLPYIHQRQQFGKAIGEFQLMQGKLADMYVDLNSARSYLYTVARACDRGETTRADSAAVILYAAERATQLALQTIQTLGGNGYMNEFPAGRLLRDAKLYEIGAGTSEIRRMLIGRELFEATE